MRTIIYSMALLATVSVSTSVFAQEREEPFGHRGTFAIEGQTASPLVNPQAASDLGVSTPFVGLQTIHTSTGQYTWEDITSLYFDARVHYFVIDHLSIGLEFAWMTELDHTLTTHDPVADTNLSGPLAQADSIGVMPMVGYDIPLGSNFSIWPKVGLGYYHWDSGDGEHADWWFLNLEASFVWHPVRHLALAAGPGFSFNITGSDWTDGNPGYNLFANQFRWLTLDAIGWF